MRIENHLASAGTVPRIRTFPAMHTFTVGVVALMECIFRKEHEIHAVTRDTRSSSPAAAAD